MKVIVVPALQVPLLKQSRVTLSVLGHTTGLHQNKDQSVPIPVALVPFAPLASLCCADTT